MRHCEIESRYGCGARLLAIQSTPCSGSTTGLAGAAQNSTLQEELPGRIFDSLRDGRHRRCLSVTSKKPTALVSCSSNSGDVGLTEEAASITATILWTVHRVALGATRLCGAIPERRPRQPRGERSSAQYASVILELIEVCVHGRRCRISSWNEPGINRRYEWRGTRAH